MSWTPEKVEKLKELWGKGNTASEIAQILGGVTRNAVIGKAHRLNLSSKMKPRSSSHVNKKIINNQEDKIKFKGRRGKFKSLILDKNFEEAKKQLADYEKKIGALREKLGYTRVLGMLPQGASSGQHLSW